ncbi:MAG: hypothetical protein D6815_01015 [Candidatus Dadabacteria bacterium]|nr:MAG: hypothetical protein D6815_01015 [Candidatus Dadabacteria bacterium]
MTGVTKLRRVPAVRLKAGVIRIASRACLAAWLAVAACSLAVCSARAHVDRIERRSRELALPDPVLDPSWPDLETAPASTVPADEAGRDATDPGEAVEVEPSTPPERVAPNPDDAGDSEPFGTATHPDGSDGFGPDPSEW